MGLDIAAYSELTIMNKYNEDEDDNGLTFYINSDFPDNAKDIVEGCNYSYYGSYSFGVGSYSSYNSWRHTLAQLINFRSAKDFWVSAETTSPFYELINFSDCEGTIGTYVSCGLYQDFCDYQTEADNTENEYFIKVYNNFKKAFLLASCDGAVKFS